MFRNLTESEIDVFPKMVKESGCMVLLFKNARCDMNILDETVGPLNWKRDHQIINGNFFCTVSLYDERKKEWISKQDVGVESFSDKEKGQASDSFKRACFNWGIGRELYTTPFIWIKLNPGETYTFKDKVKLDNKVKFKLNKINTIDGKVVEIEIVDQNNKQRYKWIDKARNTDVIQNSKGSLDKNNKKVMNSSNESTNKCKDCGSNISENVKKYSVNKLGSPYCLECQKKHKK